MRVSVTANLFERSEADIDQCPPGGREGIVRLAAITGRPPKPLSAEFGTEGPRHLAVIDEAWCIGCTLCLDACPTDAIVGIHKRMHTVIEPHCTGCELCIPVCPVDCISLEDVTPGRSGWTAWSQQQADDALARYRTHSARRPVREGANALPAETAGAAPAADRKRTIVEAALARARASRPAR